MRIAVILTLVLTMSLQGRALDVREAVERVLEKDPAVLISEQSVNLAYNAFYRARSDVLPQLSLSSDYSVLYKPEVHNSVSPYDILYERYGSQTLTTGLTLSQVLPNLSLSLDQPIFYNGKFIDLSVLPSSIRKERIGYFQAETSHRVSQNAAVRSMLAFYYNVVLLRKRIDMLERSFWLQQENVKKMERNYELGLVSETDVWSARILAGEQREVILDARYSLLRAEGSLRASIGMDGSSVLAPLSEIPDLEIFSDPDELAGMALEQNRAVLQEALNLEQKQIDLKTSGVNHAPTLKFSFALFPSYPAGRDDKSFSSSFTDFFSDEAEMNYRMSVGLQVPLYNGSKARYEREMGLASEHIARLNLALRKAAVIQDLQSLLLRKSSLKEKIRLLADNAKLVERRVEIEKQLLDLGKSTGQEVKSVELDFTVKTDNLWNARKDLFLLLLDIHDLIGNDIAGILLTR
jgi:outer membrane protein TolC